MECFTTLEDARRRTLALLDDILGPPGTRDGVCAVDAALMAICGGPEPEAEPAEIIHADPGCLPDSPLGRDARLTAVVAALDSTARALLTVPTRRRYTEVPEGFCPGVRQLLGDHRWDQMGMIDPAMTPTFLPEPRDFLGMRARVGGLDPASLLSALEIHGSVAALRDVLGSAYGGLDAELAMVRDTLRRIADEPERSVAMLPDLSATMGRIRRRLVAEQEAEKAAREMARRRLLSMRVRSVGDATLDELRNLLATKGEKE